MAKANNYQKAVEEMSVFDKDAVKLIPEEIKDENKGHYNCLMVKRIHDSVNQKYTTQVKVQCYDNRGFEKAKKSFGILGCAKLIILHTPEQVTPRIPDEYLGKEGVKTKEEIDNEIEAKATEKAQQLVDEKMKSVKTPEEIEEEIEKRANEKAQEIVAKSTQVLPKEMDLTSFKLDELREFAKQNEIDLKGIDAKADVLATIQAWQKA